MKINYIVLILLSCLMFSCKQKLNIIYLQNEISEVYDDDYAYFVHICIAFDSSMIGNKIHLKNYSTNEVAIDGTLVKKENDSIVKFKWLPNNPNDWDLKINEFEHHIEVYTYRKYRYLLIKKINNRINLIYTNKSPIIRKKTESVTE